MIRTKKGLLQSQEWANKLEQALDQLRMEGLPPLEHRLVASGYISELQKVRQDIDDYLGLVPMNERQMPKQKRQRTKTAAKKITA